MVNRLAAASPELKAGVAYYGRQIPAARVAAIRAPLLLHYAGLDEPVNAGIPAYETALKETGKRYTIHVYPNVNHAFNNDTGAARYNKEAADLAWGRTLAFFKENLGRTERRVTARLSPFRQSHEALSAPRRCQDQQRQLSTGLARFFSGRVLVDLDLDAMIQGRGDHVDMLDVGRQQGVEVDALAARHRHAGATSDRSARRLRPPRDGCTGSA